MDESSKTTAQGEIIMKDNLFDIRIALARPDTYAISTDFTDRVMATVASSEILSAHVRNMSVNKKETFMMKLRHLPKFAIIAIAIGALLLLAGTTYAVVQTIKDVNVDQSGTNKFGREQLQVTFNGCEDQQQRGTTYEVKRGSNLSAEDGVKVLEARCQLDVIEKWVANDTKSQQIMGDRAGASVYIGIGGVDTVDTIGTGSITLKMAGEKGLPQDTRFVEDGNLIDKSDIKPGDSVMYFNPHFYSFSFRSTDSTPTDSIVVFKLPLDARYYNLDYQSYVTSRGPCMSNPTRTCLIASNINHTILIVEYGGAFHTIDEREDTKQLQGIVKSYDDQSIKLDVGEGVIYTLETPHNVVDKYNTSTVYGLASLDGIYAKTDPEALKIKVGDSLDIYYLESSSESSHTISWGMALTIGLMVERIPNNLDVLQKY